jgi:hypothetical protein
MRIMIVMREIVQGHNAEWVNLSLSLAIGNGSRGRRVGRAVQNIDRAQRW